MFAAHDPLLPAIHFVLVNSREFSNDAAKSDYVPEILSLTASRKARRQPTVADVTAELLDGFRCLPKGTPLFFHHGEVEEWFLAFKRDCHDTPCLDVTVVAGRRPMMVFVKGISGKTSTLRCTPANTIGDLQWLLWRKDGIPADQQRLLFSGAQLEPGATVARSNLKPNSTVHLVLRLRGGMLHETSGRADMAPLAAAAAAAPAPAPAPPLAEPVVLVCGSDDGHAVAEGSDDARCDFCQHLGEVLVNVTPSEGNTVLEKALETSRGASAVALAARAVLPEGSELHAVLSCCRGVVRLPKTPKNPSGLYLLFDWVDEVERASYVLEEVGWGTMVCGRVRRSHCQCGKGEHGDATKCE
jgi:hypothetical protein